MIEIALCLQLPWYSVFYFLLYFFRVFDKDLDGYLAVEELGTFLTTMGNKMSNKEVEDMMKLVDRNSEGFIDSKGN